MNDENNDDFLGNAINKMMPSFTFVDNGLGKMMKTEKKEVAETEEVY